nr:hypothetical protein [uncultured Flavobacterium sp.]
MQRKKYLITFFIFLCFSYLTFGQDRFIYHSRNQEQIKIYDSHKESVTNEPLHIAEGSKIKVRILNPNPLFYKYELKYVEQEVQSEDKVLTDALAQIGSLITNTQRGLNLVQQSDFNMYVSKVNSLMTEITKAQSIIDNSDLPEVESDALVGNRNGGLRYAIDQISGKAMQPVSGLTFDSCGFHDPVLLNSLNELIDKLANIISSNEMKIYKLANNTLAKKVQEMKKTMSEVKAEIDEEFTVTEKEGVIYLVITPIDANRHNLRKLHSEDAKLEILRIIPDFKRAVIELVPVGNLMYSGSYEEYYLEEGLVQKREVSKAFFRPGIVLNINLHSFGKTKEMAAGLGLGYKLSENENGIENLYLSTLFSYKSFIRVGLGIGWGQFPSGLKSGGQVGQALPDNVSNLEDLVNYKDKPTVFLTLAFAALNVSKKK